jgi:C4-type Zn-finger protein
LKGERGTLATGFDIKNVTFEYLDTVQNIFMTDMFQHFECLRKLKRAKKGKEEVTIVIHDPGEISKFNEPY